MLLKIEKEGKMELEINNKIGNKTTDKEVTNFINELNNALGKKQELNTNSNLYNEILEDVELASKYKNILQSTIHKCLKEMSYEREFFYFDYDKEIKEYNLKYFWNGGNIVCDNLSTKDIERYKKAGFTFYEPIDEEGTIVASDSLKDWMKCEVESALLDIDIKNRKIKEDK